VKQDYDHRLVTAAEARLNEKFMHIMVFKVEADWAFAMNMKQAMSNQERNAKQEESKAGLKNQSLLN